MNSHQQDVARMIADEAVSISTQVVRLMFEQLAMERAKNCVLEQQVLEVSEELAAAHASTREAYEKVEIMQHRCEELDVPPACSCGRVGYEASCKKCGVRLK